MSMRKFASVVILILCMSLTSCSKQGLSDDEKCGVVCEIAGVCLEHYSEGNCEKEKDISMDQGSTEIRYILTQKSKTESISILPDYKRCNHYYK